MASTIYYLDTRKREKDKNDTDKYPLKFMLSHRSKSVPIKEAPKFYLKQDDWDSENQKISKSCKYYNVIDSNLRLADFKIKTDRYFENLKEEVNLDKYTSIELRTIYIETLNNKKNNKEENKDAFLPFILEYSNSHKNENPDKSTWRGYLDTYNLLIEYLISKNKKENDLKLSEITVDFLKLFDYFMEYDSKKTHKPNTRAIHFRNIKTIYNLQKKRLSTTPPNPFEEFEIPGETTIHKDLNVMDIKLLFSYEGKSNELQAIKLFKLSFFLMGLNFKDILYRKKYDIYNNRLYFKRAKTDKDLSIPISSEAQKIIDEFEGDEYLISILEEKLKTARKERRTPIYKDVISQTNKLLKRIFKELNINIPVSTNFARHSFATITNGAGIETKHVQKCLGHSNKETIDRYINVNQKLIDKAHDEFLFYFRNYEKIIIKEIKDKVLRQKDIDGWDYKFKVLNLYKENNIKINKKHIKFGRFRKNRLKLKLW